ncbi:phosphotransferase [Variovorax sp. Root411]|uniref:phosphotransferase n=1 Tax=Variovorax sp. Root411 TaxID=1736530 RepID=UPI0006F9D72A|nr:phosphotransferase [Variovorax sp. Root411]KQW56379.1 aminoglycoside phosphotransferase [Variovorax sp. Root411]
MGPFTGTKAVSERHSFDVAALERYLSARLTGFAGPLTVAQFRGGQSNPTYKLETPGKAYVMRAKPAAAAKLLPSAHAIEREFRVLSALWGTDVPVPQTYLLCEDEAVVGRAFYVMEFVEGRVFWDQSLPGMTNAERSAIYDEMNRVMAALHCINVADVGLASFGKPGNYFERQIGRWSKQYIASVTEPIDAMNKLMQWLPERIPSAARDESQTSVVHGDFRIDNVIFHPTEPRVLAVLDWELSTLGHPLADFSYHCVGWHIANGTGPGIDAVDIAALGIPSEREYVRRYCERTRRDNVDAVIADWNFYLAYNLFRIAAIVQGITKRSLDGTAASAHAAQASGPGASRIAALGWQFAQAS